MNVSAHQYSPLTAPSELIRLLKIRPQPLEHQISCDLVTYSVANLPSYVALSYTWGPPEELGSLQAQSPKAKLFIDSRPLDITLNLFHALRELIGRIANKADTQILLWIDAVCIDQHNTEERNQQVALMDVIYSRAQKVIVWMGEDTRNEARLVRDIHSKIIKMDQLIHDIGQELFKRNRKAFEDLSGTGYVILDKMKILRQRPEAFMDAVALPSIDDKKWEILLSFYRRRWFSRIWIVQEIALAKEVEIWFGHENLTWEGVYACSSILNGFLENFILFGNLPRGSTREEDGYVFHSIKALMIATIREWSTSGNLSTSDWPTYRLLNGSQQYDVQKAGFCVFVKAMKFAASHPLDKIFGLLGVLKRLTRSEKTFIDIDYKHDKATVFTNVTRAILQQTNWLGFLCNISADTSKRCSGLPSWAVDPEQNPLSILALQWNQTFNAAGHWVSSIEHPAPDLTFHRNVLSVYGIRLAVIDGKSESLDEFFKAKGDFEEGINLFSVQPAIYRHTNEPLLDILWRTMILNNVRYIPVEQWRLSFKNWWLLKLLVRATDGGATGYSALNYLETIPNALLLAEQDSTGVLVTRRELSNVVKNVIQGKSVPGVIWGKQLLFSDAAGEWAPRRRMFRCCERFYGLGPTGLEIGDEVWIMPRSQMPFILRNSLNSSSPNRYSFIGECYVHGVMYGEHLDSEEPPQWDAVELE